MNYLENKKRNLIRLTQRSILISSMAIPTITNTNYASAMFNNLARGAVRSTGATGSSNVKSLVGKFEQISTSTTSTTLKNGPLKNEGFTYLKPNLPTITHKISSSPKTKPKSTLMSKFFSGLTSSSKSDKTRSSSKTITEPKLLPKPQTEPTSSPTTTPKKVLLPTSPIQSTNTKPTDESTPSPTNTSGQVSTLQKPTSKPPIAPKPTPKSILLYQSKLDQTKTSTQQSSKTSKSTVRFNLPDNNTLSTPPKKEHTYDEVSTTTSLGSSTSDEKSTYTLKIGEGLGHEYDPYKPTSKQQSNLESMLKGTVAIIVKNNLPDRVPRTNPITIEFDSESGHHLNQALTSFILRSAIQTLNSIDKQQQT